MPLNADELRAKYWRMKSMVEKAKITPTLDREIGMLQIELQSEIAALLSEQNEILKRTIGLMNVEELLLELGKILREKGKACSDLRKES